MGSYDMFLQTSTTRLWKIAPMRQRSFGPYSQGKSKGKEYLGACLWHRIGFEAFVEIL